jgi:hypothetical protein
LKTAGLAFCLSRSQWCLLIVVIVESSGKLIGVLHLGVRVDWATELVLVTVVSVLLENAVIGTD